MPEGTLFSEASAPVLHVSEYSVLPLKYSLIKLHGIAVVSVLVHCVESCQVVKLRDALPPVVFL